MQSLLLFFVCGGFFTLCGLNCVLDPDIGLTFGTGFMLFVLGIGQIIGGIIWAKTGGVEKEEEDKRKAMQAQAEVYAKQRMAGISHENTDLAKSMQPKDASVVGRAVVGGIIGGEAGAVIGAMSAIEENNKKHQK